MYLYAYAIENCTPHVTSLLITTPNGGPAKSNVHYFCFLGVFVNILNGRGEILNAQMKLKYFFLNSLECIQLI